MSIDFHTFLKKTGFTAAYAARKILYFPKSRPALMAGSLSLDVEKHRSDLVRAVNGRLQLEEVETNSTETGSKSESPQIDLIETQSKAEDSVA